IGTVVRRRNRAAGGGVACRRIAAGGEAPRLQHCAVPSCVLRSPPMSATLIRNGRIVTAVDDYTADVLLDKGRIVTIGEALEAGGDTRIVDARGLVVLPGGVDCHTHMENTFGESTTCDTFESGTRSAAFGGTTTIVDFAFQRKGTSVLEAIRAGQ